MHLHSCQKEEKLSITPSTKISPFCALPKKNILERRHDLCHGQTNLPKVLLCFKNNYTPSRHPLAVT